MPYSGKTQKLGTLNSRPNKTDKNCQLESCRSSINFYESLFDSRDCDEASPVYIKCQKWMQVSLKREGIKQNQIRTYVTENPQINCISVIFLAHNRKVLFSEFYQVTLYYF